MTKRLFIASSVESLDVAYAIQENVEYDLDVVVWSQGVFEISKSAIESLVGEAHEFDSAVFVFSPDDTSIIRGEEKPSVRDNVIFELGLFIGALGRENCFIVMPRSFSHLDLPTDLLGITPATYNDQRKDNNLVAALGPTANKIRRALVPSKKKPRAPASLEGIVTAMPYRLFYNPKTKRSKRMVFRAKGVIVEGNNKNEHSWRVRHNLLELLQLDGKVHSRFSYDEGRQIFEHTNDEDTLSIRGQFMVPDVPNA